MKLKRAAVRFRFADLATIDYAIMGYIPHINHVIGFLPLRKRLRQFSHTVLAGNIRSTRAPGRAVYLSGCHA